MAGYLYVVMVLEGATAVPHWDDYNLVYRFLDRWASASLPERLDLLWAPHNEHRLFVPRALIAFLAAAGVAVDLGVLIPVCSSVLAAVVVVLVRLSPGRWRPVVAFVATVLLMSPLQGDAVVWFTSVVSNYWVLAAAVLALAAGAAGRPTAAAAAWAVAFGSQGNGMFTAPACLVASYWSGSSRRTLALWAGLSASSAFYAIGQEQVLGHCSPTFAAPLSYAWSLVLYVITFLGCWSPVATPNGALAAGTLTAAGAVAGVAVTWRDREGTWRKGDGLLVGLLVFIILSAAANGMARVCLHPYYPAYQGRYRVFAGAAAAGVLVLLLRAASSRAGRRPIRRVSAAVSAGASAAAVWILAYYSMGLQAVGDWRGNLEQGYDVSLVRTDGEGLSFAFPTVALGYLDSARRRGEFPSDPVPLPSPPPSLEPFPRPRPLPSGAATVSGPLGTVVHGWVLPPADVPSGHRVSVVLHDINGRREEYAARRRTRGDVNQAFGLSSLARVGFVARFRRPDGAAPVAAVFLGIRGPDGKAVASTGIRPEGDPL